MKAYRCLYCRAALGYTTGDVLQVANCIFRRKTQIECGNCHRVRWWKPPAGLPLAGLVTAQPLITFVECHIEMASSP